MTNKQYNLLSARSRYLDTELYTRILAFASDVVREGINGQPKTPVKTLPYEDIRTVIDSVVNAEDYHYNFSVLKNPLAEEAEQKELKKLTDILEKHGYQRTVQGFTSSQERNRSN